jgi:predicted neutral ceramidase superfamily lipid hydrolase
MSASLAENMRCTSCGWLLGSSLVIAIVVGILHGMMNGFWTGLGLSLALTLVWAAMNLETVKYSLGVSPLKITSWIMFILLTSLFYIIFIETFQFPSAGSLILATITVAFGWWSYYTLEPAKA